MKKEDVKKVMSFLGKKSAAKRDRSYYVKLGKKNKGKSKPGRSLKQVV